MRTSLFLAKLAGPLLVLVGIAMIADPTGWQALAVDFMRSPGLMYFAAMVGFAASLAIVLTHNVWVGDWRIILTLLGWIGIFDSTSWLLVPQRAAAVWTPIVQLGWFVPVTGITVLLLGLVLGYFGYVAERRDGRQA